MAWVAWSRLAQLKEEDGMGWDCEIFKALMMLS